ncbi:hypothetical protein E2562_001292 [Oryza meyeriana var. granulata]|uniref:Uncharacterized protein n=1 Tax=Oryza meyeriana var. granulata TaxID=110450 RepID=A0A6G1DCA1_9ORYZ|nr:hypothetical protein E2562_001292 [Oryza meyeriana var. granulata]
MAVTPESKKNAVPRTHGGDHLEQCKNPGQLSSGADEDLKDRRGKEGREAQRTVEGHTDTLTCAARAALSLLPK